MKHYTQNRKGLRLAVAVEGALDSGKLVFIVHGLTGSKDQAHIVAMREAFAEAGFAVVAFDTSHSWGESDGDSIHATATSYIEDLEDVISWAKGQTWYKEPFVLAGHSLGSISSLVYTSCHPRKVRAVFPMSTPASGKLWYESKSSAFLKGWKQKGYYFKQSKSMPGKSGRIGWSLAEDMLTYDALKFAPEIDCPVLLIVGEKDDDTTPEMHQLLHKKLAGPTELHTIKNMEHTPRSSKEMLEIKQIVSAWLKNHNI